MKRTAVNRQFLRLLVSAYNRSIQTYHHFPEVILCGGQRLEQEDLQALLAAGYLVKDSTDSFGTFYRLSASGEAYLFAAIFRRRSKPPLAVSALQARLSFTGEVC